MCKIEDLYTHFGPLRQRIIDNKLDESINTSDELQYLLSIHNSGESKHIQRKMWHNKPLKEFEKIYIKLFSEYIQTIPSFDNELIFRYEVNLSLQKLNLLKKKIKQGDLFINKAFWNYSANENWKNDHFKWILKTKEINSVAKKAYIYYGDAGLYEKEIIIPPKTKFLVKKISKNEVEIIEI